MIIRNQSLQPTAICSTLLKKNKAHDVAYTLITYDIKYFTTIKLVNELLNVSAQLYSMVGSYNMTNLLLFAILPWTFLIPSGSF